MRLNERLEVVGSRTWLVFWFLVTIGEPWPAVSRNTFEVHLFSEHGPARTFILDDAATAQFAFGSKLLRPCPHKGFAGLGNGLCRSDR
jgi:hypothetical protein